MYSSALAEQITTTRANSDSGDATEQENCFGFGKCIVFILACVYERIIVQIVIVDYHMWLF